MWWQNVQTKLRFRVRALWARPGMTCLSYATPRAGTISSLMTTNLSSSVRPKLVVMRDVGGVAAARHQDAADAREVVAGVEGVPAAAEIDFEPALEIHRRRVGRHADVAEIAGAIARRNVHAAAEA